MPTARILVVGLFVVIIAILSGIVQDVQDAQAIPAFARKYDFACNVCHVPSFPKLNDFGNLFRDHGYQLGTDQELPTFEGLTKGYWPVSLRTTVGYQFQSTRGLANFSGAPGDVTATSGAFGFTGLDILSFGILARDISFGIVVTPDVSGGGFVGGASGATDLEAAFVKIDNLQRFIGLGDNNYLMNFKVGKYELDLPFSVKRSPTLNSDMLIYTYIAGVPSIGGTAFGITNANNFAFSGNHFGAELAGIAPTALTNGYFRYSLNALSNQDNDGLGTTGGGRAMQFYGHVTQSFGGYGIVSGHRVGLFGMYGRAPTAPNAASDTVTPIILPGTGEVNATFSRMGVDASTTWGGQVNVFGAWLFAKDTTPLFTTGQEAHWNGGFIEADYNPTSLPKWLFIYRYDWITNTQQAGAVTGNFNNTQQHTAAIRYNFMFSNRTDIALHLEYNHLRDKFTAASGGDSTQDTMLVGFDFAL